MKVLVILITNLVGIDGIISDFNHQSDWFHCNSFCDTPFGKDLPRCPSTMHFCKATGIHATRIHVTRISATMLRSTGFWQHHGKNCRVSWRKKEFVPNTVRFTLAGRHCLISEVFWAFCTKSQNMQEIKQCLWANENEVFVVTCYMVKWCHSYTCYYIYTIIQYHSARCYMLLCYSRILTLMFVKSWKNYGKMGVSQK